MAYGTKRTACALPANMQPYSSSKWDYVQRSLWVGGASTTQQSLPLQNDWSAAMGGCGLFKIDRVGQQGGRIALLWNEWGSSWGQVMSKVRAYDLEVEAKLRGTMLTSATGCLIGKKLQETSKKKWKVHPIWRPWSSWRILTILISTKGTTQQDKSNPGVFWSALVISWHREKRNQGGEGKFLQVLQTRK